MCEQVNQRQGFIGRLDNPALFGSQFQLKMSKLIRSRGYLRRI